MTAIEMIKGRPPYSEMHPMKAVSSGFSHLIVVSV